MSEFLSAFSWINIRFLLMGLWVTIEVAVVSVILSFIIGSVLGVIRYVKIPYLSKIVGFIIDLIRNLPLLLIIFFTYFALPKIGIHLGVMTSTIFALTIFESAMLAEVIRSGIVAVPKGQLEGALSNGLSFKQALWYIILPQAYKKMIPPIVSQFVSLIKDISCTNYLCARTKCDCRNVLCTSCFVLRLELRHLKDWSYSRSSHGSLTLKALLFVLNGSAFCL